MTIKSFRDLLKNNGKKTGQKTSSCSGSCFSEEDAEDTEAGYLNPAMNISGSVACVFLLNISENNWYFDSNWPKIGLGEMGYRFIYKKYTNICT